MALLAFWKSNREQVLGQTIQQIVSNAGDGKPRDGSLCSAELRQFFGEVPSDYLGRYISACLEAPFQDSGLVLQDLVNEIGRRLDFQVEVGPYRGRKSGIGFDGVWRARGSRDLLVEVKSTDYIAISLEKIAAYKDRLVKERRLGRDACFLIVVGREDTGALEAQIRGSRYAWEMRLISVDSLVKLLKIKRQSSEESTIGKIRALLHPFEYTRVDKIIDVIFAAAENEEPQPVPAEGGRTAAEPEAEAGELKRERPGRGPGILRAGRWNFGRWN